MKKRSLLLIVLLMAALLLLSISVVSAKPVSPGPIDCLLDITYDVHEENELPYWLGTVEGPDCSVAGTIEFYAVPEEYFDAGNTKHFVELFVIKTGGGNIYGKNYGVWNLKSFKFQANGWVTDATGEWEHMVGYKYHESGFTSDLDDGLPLTTSEGKMKMVPANKQNTP